MIGDVLLMMCAKFHMKYPLGMTANQWMKRPMYRISETLASLSVYKAYGKYSKERKHWPFHSLICGHSQVSFHMKIFTHNWKSIPSHKPLSKFASYATWRKCMTSNFHLIFTFYVYPVFIEAWRIKSSIRMELDKPPEDVRVHNLQ